MHDLMILAIVCYIFLHKGILKRVVNQNIQYHLNNYTQGSKFPFPTPSIYESAKKHPELMQAWKLCPWVLWEKKTSTKQGQDQRYLCSTQGHCEETESNMEDGQEEHENVQLMHAVGWNKRHHALPPSPGLAQMMRWTSQSRIAWRLSTDEAKSRQQDNGLSVYPYIHLGIQGFK